MLFFIKRGETVGSNWFFFCNSDFVYFWLFISVVELYIEVDICLVGENSGRDFVRGLVWFN